ncbi:MAG: FkbM family methyltransferase [Proteobacteria bacterium]|nr:FkbM family methyltransferase [Pseudomonadota bacterium]
MTKAFATFLAALVTALTCFLPRWKRLTVRARLYEKLQPFEEVAFEDRTLKLLIPDRTSIYWAKSGLQIEPMTNRWIASFSKEDVFFDIGANIGLYSLSAAAHGVAKVFAFEPNPFSFGVLARNIVANEFGSQIVPVCLAMSDESSIVSFKLSGTHAGSIGNEIAHDGSTGGGILVQSAAFSVDEFVRVQGISRVTHLKIDVDGLELEILQGAPEILANPALKSVLVEDNSTDGQGEYALISFLEKFDLQVSNGWGPDGTDNKIFVRKSQ